MLVQFAFHALVCSLNYVGLHCISVLLVLAFRFTADFCAFVHIFFPLCVVFFFGRCCCFIQYNLLWLLFLFSSTKNERKFSFCSFCSCTWNWFRKKNRSKMLEQKRRHIRRTVTEITKIIFKKSTQKIAGTHNFQYSCHSYVFGTCFYWWWIFLSLSRSLVWHMPFNGTTAPHHSQSGRCIPEFYVHSTVLYVSWSNHLQMDTICFCCYCCY